jgi:site-specific DNA recombinase
LVIELANPKGADPKRKPSRSVIEVPWHKTPSTRRREVLIPEAGPPPDTRPIRSENRAILVASIARGRRWLDELIADPAATTESIAGRESCTTRKINRTISLAFLAPELVKRPLMDGSRTAWELRVSPICLPNGPASAGCLASQC